MKLLLLFSVVAFVYGLGHWEPIPTDHENVVSAAHYACKSLSFRMNYAFHGKLAHVHKAEKQIVSGINYRLELTVGITECKKNKIDYEKIDDCEFQDGLFQRCTVVVYQNWQQVYKLTKFECKPDSRDEAVSNTVEKSMFKDFVAHFKKTYKDEAEEAQKFENFQNNLKKIKLLNDHERGSAQYGITEFTDMTEEEFKKNKLGFRPDLLNVDEPLPTAAIPKDPLPTSYDWRDHGVVSEVKNQGSCGSCWAFSTTGNIEGQWALKKKNLISLSEQELVDCDKVDQGCDGGLPSNAYKEIIRLGGLEGEKDYPYEGTDDKCELKKKEIRVFINSSIAISSNETEMAQWLVENGPISIGINANAMQGYYRVYRGDGTCGVNTMATSSIVD